MKNLAQLYLLAALTVVPSLAADLTPSDSDFLPMSNPKPKFEGFSSGIVPTTDTSKLAKRQGRCAAANSYICPNVDKCCPVGYNCVGSGMNTGCCPIGRICDPSITYCPAGQTSCADIIGVSGCCPTATHKCSTSSSGTPGCERLGSSGGSSGSSTSVCDPGTYMCADGLGCCPNGSTCVPGAMLCRKTGSFSLSVSIPAATSSKALTSGTTLINPFTTISTRPAPTPETSLINPFTTISTRPTTTIADLEPTTPPKIDDQGSSSSTEPVETGLRPSATVSTVSTGSSNSGNALKPGGWLGGFGIAFFFALFHL